MGAIKKVLRKLGLKSSKKKAETGSGGGTTRKLTAAEVAAIQRNMNMGGAGGPRRFPLTMLGGGLGGDRDRDML